MWSIPKGEAHPGEDLLEAAKREFEEELRFRADGAFVPLSPIRQKSGKIVHAWAFAGDCDPARIQSNSFAMEWPPHSGRTGTFPEVDRAEFLNLEQAKARINPAQTGSAGGIAAEACGWRVKFHDRKPGLYYEARRRLKPPPGLSHVLLDIGSPRLLPF